MRKLLLIPFLLAAGACEGGGGGSTGGTDLTAAEAVELNRVMFGMVAGLGPGATGPDLRSQAWDVGETFTIPVTETVPCYSGSIGVDGTLNVQLDNTGQQLSLQATLAGTPNPCVVRMANGVLFTITGNPSLNAQISMAGNVNGQLSSLQVTETGGFKWTSGGSSGTCAVNLTSSLNAASQVVTVSGTFCGFTVSESFPIQQA
jgi:hypothetical protein